MENASKALIIAGAILLSILIITLGIAVFGQASGVVNNNAMSEIEIQQFNQKFTQYEGERVRGAQVNTLLQTVLSNNLTADDADRKVTVNLGTGDGIKMSTTDTSISTKAATGATYTVKCAYGTGSRAGLVTNITVTKNPST